MTISSSRTSNALFTKPLPATITLWLFLVLSLLAVTVHAQSITSIQLQNRPADEIIPVIKPMLQPGDAISGRGFKLFLRSSAETLVQVREMLEVLDAAAKLLQVSVFQGSTRGLNRLGIDGRIRAESDGASVDIGKNGGDGRGGQLTYGTDNANVSIGGVGTQMRLQDNPVHQVRVVEGAEAYIETGETIPYFSGPGGLLGGISSAGVEFRNVVTGFYVLPRVRGDNVTLQVSPFKNARGQGGDASIRTQQANTTVSGRLGEWLLIGGVSEQVKQAHSGTGSYASTRARNNESIWIKAELVR